jgi:hypothetical protein
MEARERSIGELISELVRKAAVLVQEEVALARAEMSTKASTVSRSAGMLAGGGAIAYSGFLAIAAAIPKTSVEDQIAGPARERVAKPARQVGEKVGRVAERAQTTVKKAAAKEDLV